MIKICLITQSTYPVPAVKGGAVEGLIEVLLDQNEKYNKLEITVPSIYCEEAKKIAKKYNSSNIIFLKYGNLIDKIQEKKIFVYINRIWMKMHGIPLLNRYYVKRICKKIDLSIFDAVIVEGGGNIYDYKELYKKVEHNKLWVHMHADIPGDKSFKKMFSKYICVSNYVARVLLMNGHINRNNVYVLPNCADILAFSEKKEYNRAEFRKNINIANDDFVFVFWGRLLPEKGVLDLVRAFDKLSKKYSNIKLLIIGNPNFGYQVDTEYMFNVKEVINKSSLSDKIIFTGFVKHDELWKYVRSSDTAVIPSVWNDAAPLVVFESFASEIPLITTRVGGVGEVANESNCIIIDWEIDFEGQLYEAMERAILEPEELKKLAKKAYKDVQKYSLDNYYDNFYNIIEQGIKQ